VDKDELLQQLKATFLDELRDHVDTMNRSLLALEKEPAEAERAELLKTLFRSAHTLKGASAAVGGDPLPEVCHQLEEILSGLQQERLSLSPELFSLLFRVIDGVEATSMLLRDEQSLEDSPLRELLLDLEAAAGKISAEPAPVSAGGEAPAAAAESHPAEDEPPPPADRASPAPGEVPEQAHRARQETPAPVAERLGGTLRVAAEKLDSLLAQTGELLVARRRVESRFADVAELRDLVAAWRREWHRLKLPAAAHSSAAAGPVPGEVAARGSVLSPRSALAIAQHNDRLRHLERKLDQVAANLAADGRILNQSCSALDDDVEHIRMFPFSQACAGLERAVRDLARSQSKAVRLVIEGGEVEVDRSVLEGLKDPLLHLVRNAVDHGIETPEQREQAGKPREATLTVAASIRGAQVEVYVADDGRGFNLEHIREKARKRGLPEPQDELELARSVFLPGFSTAEIITEVSGRGVGLDVVQQRIETLHGTVDVSYEAGAGTRFTLAVPLTLTKIRSVLLVAGGQTYAIPTAQVVQLVRFDLNQLRSVAARDTLLLGETRIDTVRLASMLGGSRERVSPSQTKALALILTMGIQRVAFVVDEVLGEQEIVVKSLGHRIRRLRHVSGGTILPSGRVGLVLNVPSLIRAASQQPTAASIAPEAEPSAGAATHRLLVVDDSVTTRTLLRSILDGAGFEVATAADGEQAWQLLASNKFDLVVADVDMPLLDGFALTKNIRESEELHKLPVILLTARETDEDKTRGVAAGADAYLVKSTFDQRDLLECIAHLV
jgi:two-component system chemotaxis sensor kinase CheA